MTGNTPQAEVCIAWLQKTGQFSEKELTRIRRIRLFKEDQAGQLILTENRMSLGVAAALLSLVCLLAGIWIGWLVFGAKGDLQGIINSFVLGTIAGSTISFILDNSFRFDKMSTKVKLVAPWMSCQGQ